MLGRKRTHKTMNAKLPSGTLEKLWSDSSNWRAGIIYVCKDDPRFIVPRRMKWGGWTLNFAHASAWVALLVCVLSMIVPAVFFLLTGLAGTVVWFAFLAGIIVSWCVLSAVLSSPNDTKRQANRAHTLDAGFRLLSQSGTIGPRQ